MRDKLRNFAEAHGWTVLFIIMGTCLLGLGIAGRVTS